MSKTPNPMAFSGEFFIPGHSPATLEKDHFERYRFAAKYAKDKSVLDIACGTGYGSRILLDAGAKSYQGVDISDVPIRYAQENYRDDKALFSTGNICTFSPGRTYSLITCFETIEHISVYKEALGNLSQLLDKDGLLIISSPNRLICSPNAKTLTDKPSNPFHTQEFTPQELLSVISEAGFVSAEQHVYGQRLRPFKAIHRLLYKSRPTRVLCYMLSGNPNANASAVVAPVVNLEPRYFIIVAKLTGK